MIDIEDIKIENLRNNMFKEELKEFYDLKDVIENNRWHDNESTFDHTLRVLEAYDLFLKGANERVRKYLEKNPDGQDSFYRALLVKFENNPEKRQGI